jgi:hypothetical protein
LDESRSSSLIDNLLSLFSDEEFGRSKIEGGERSSGAKEKDK